MAIQTGGCEESLRRGAVRTLGSRPRVTLPSLAPRGGRAQRYGWRASWADVDGSEEGKWERRRVHVDVDDRRATARESIELLAPVEVVLSLLLFAVAVTMSPASLLATISVNVSRSTVHR